MLSISKYHVVIVMHGNRGVVLRLPKILLEIGIEK